MINIHRILNVVIRPFRKRRMKKFLELIEPKPTDRILDVGGTAYNWTLIDYENSVVLLNLSAPNEGVESIPENLSFVIGDGTMLKYDDGEYDICFSNSVIEHVGVFEKQRAFAQEICRVGKRVLVQTPAKSFFLEPHYITPFVHWLPKSYQKKLLRNFSIWGLMTRPCQQYVDDVVDQTRLLSFKELENLFPGCMIKKEKFLFMTKAYLIIRT